MKRRRKRIRKGIGDLQFVDVYGQQYSVEINQNIAKSNIMIHYLFMMETD